MQKEAVKRRLIWKLQDILNIKGNTRYHYRMEFGQFDHSTRDRPGGHRQNELKDYISHEWPDENFGKRRARLKAQEKRCMRREHRKITAEALRDYHEEMEDRRLDELHDYYESYYNDPYYDEFEKYDVEEDARRYDYDDMDYSDLCDYDYHDLRLEDDWDDVHFSFSAPEQMMEISESEYLELKRKADLYDMSR